MIEAAAIEPANLMICWLIHNSYGFRVSLFVSYHFIEVHIIQFKLFSCWVVFVHAISSNSNEFDMTL